VFSYSLNALVTKKKAKDGPSTKQFLRNDVWKTDCKCKQSAMSDFCSLNRTGSLRKFISPTYWISHSG